MKPEPIADPIRKHVISFESAEGLSSETIMNYVDPDKALPLSELKLNDLAIYPGIGLYLFYDQNNVLQYVGKCTSRSFLERIPAHFDCRKHAAFATISKRLGAEGMAGDDISSISLEALNRFKLFLVNFTYDGILRENDNYSEEEVKPFTNKEAQSVGVIERDIIQNQGPSLNRYRRVNS
jgi:hypothetical protein